MTKHRSLRWPRPPQKRITFLQSYVPDYRVPLFNILHDELTKAGIDFVVAHGQPAGGQRERSDTASGRWAIPVRQWTFQIAGKRLFWRSGIRLARRSTLVVQELASTNLVTYLFALDPRVRLMLWGHGKSYVTKTNRLDAGLERWLINRAEHVFVYTESGAEHLRSRGVDASKITVVYNSTDTEALRRATEQVTSEELASFRLQHHLGDGPVGLFVGALDESKLIPLLLDAVDIVYAKEPRFRLLVAGDGPLGQLVDQRACDRDYVLRVGRTRTAHDLAVLGGVARAILIPGRVGLVAVDALALRLPVVTTNFPFHAPEIDYLSGPQIRSSSIDAREYADAILTQLFDPPIALADSGAVGLPTIERMAKEFLSVLVPATGYRP